MKDEKVIYEDPMKRPRAQSFCEYYKDRILNKIISGEIKMTGRMVSVEEVKNMKKRPKCRKELVRQAKVGTGQLPPRQYD